MSIRQKKKKMFCNEIIKAGCFASTLQNLKHVKHFTFNAYKNMPDYASLNM